MSAFKFRVIEMDRDLKQSWLDAQERATRLVTALPSGQREFAYKAIVELSELSYQRGHEWGYRNAVSWCRYYLEDKLQSTRRKSTKTSNTKVKTNGPLSEIDKLLLESMDSEHQDHRASHRPLNEFFS